ncbi:MAG: hypothetical protein JWL97_821 [Gemmatimonadales bacterium]|nr:hypothetical protein [Gemmatimonadales bacterium]
MSRPAYTLQELGAVQTALWETIERAERRAERMPTSAEAIRRRAANIRSVRDKILDAMRTSIAATTRAENANQVQQ